MVTEANLKAFGDAVRKARVAQKMTLESLAHAAFGNLDRKGFVSQIENGRRPVSALTAGRLASVLGLSDATLDLILRNDPPEADTPTPEDTRASQLVAAVENKWPECDRYCFRSETDRHAASGIRHDGGTVHD